MDKTQIVRMASQMSTREDLLALLNHIKQEKMCESGMDVNVFYPFTMKHLLYYCNPNHTFHRYRQFKIKKKAGGFRQITAPRNRSFMMLLQSVNEILKAMYTPSDYAMGFLEQRSVVTNAFEHKGQNYVFNIDLKDFFPSVEQPRVWKRLQLAPFNFSKSIANVLAGLCSMRETRKDANGKEFFAYVLPQGAPTSPIITNMVCDTLDRRLAGLAKHFGLNYTRYADDITFSSMHNVYAPKGKFRTELIRIINEQGFTINENKIRLQKLGSRQDVTGIIVSNKLNVTKKYVRSIRCLLYIWERYGYSVAMSKFLPKYKEDKGHIKRGNPDMSKVLEGKLMYLKMVKGNDDPVFERLYNNYLGLLARDSKSNKINSYGITYIDTTPLLKFEDANETVVTFCHKDDGKRYGSFKFGEVSQLASINKDVTDKDERQKDRLAISNCRDSRGNQFWLIHSIKKVTVYNPKPVDIDELNDDLETLLLM